MRCSSDGRSASARRGRRPTSRSAGPRRDGDRPRRTAHVDRHCAVEVEEAARLRRIEVGRFPLRHVRRSRKRGGVAGHEAVARRVREDEPRDLAGRAAVVGARPRVSIADVIRSMS